MQLQIGLPLYSRRGGADQGWCSGALTFAIQQGQSDGVNLGGRTVVWLVDLPKDFVGGNGTVRIYVDDGADASQMQELEAIFTGRKGWRSSSLIQEDGHDL